MMFALYCSLLIHMFYGQTHVHGGDASDEASLMQQRITGIAAHSHESLNFGEKREAPAFIDLNYIRFEETKQQTMAVEVSIPGVSGPIQAVLDTGSSSLAFCNKDFVPQVSHLKTEYVQCNAYGPASKHPGCDEDSIQEYYYGRVYRGDIDLLTGVRSDRQVARTLNNVYYAVMDVHTGTPCQYGSDAIFGFAYPALGSASLLPNARDSDIFHACDSKNPPAAGRCLPFGPVDSTNLPNPILQSIQCDAGAAKFGIYLDYAATATNRSDTPAKALGLGRLYFNDASVTNKFYSVDKAVTVKTASAQGIPVFPNDPPSAYETELYWSFVVTTFIVLECPDKIYSVKKVDPVKFCGATECIVDSGTPFMNLPQDVYEAGVKAYANGAQPGATVSLKILKNHVVSHDEVSISFPVKFLIEQMERGYVSFSNTQLTLGLPIWEKYYIVFDSLANTIAFVDLHTE